MQQNNNWSVRITFHLGGFILMTMGIALSKRSCLGVSPVSTIPYTIAGITGMDISISTVVFHAALVALQLIILGKTFKLKNVLQIPAGILFGIFTGVFQNAANMILPDPAAFSDPIHITEALAMSLLSTVLIAAGIFFYVPADIVPLAGEGAMLAISQKSGIKFSSIKIAFDVTMVVVSFIACGIYAGRLMGGIEMKVVGIGTIIASVLVGVDLKCLIRFFGAWRGRMLHTEETADDFSSELFCLMKKDVYTIQEESSLEDALSFIVEKKISGAPVVDASGKLTGFISDGDILRFLSSESSPFIMPSQLDSKDFSEKIGLLKKQKAKEIAEKRVVTVNIDASLDEVCSVLHENSLKKVPVMQEGRMVGIINRSNITKYILKKIEM